MFYFLLPTLLSYNFILLAAAVIPAIFLMIKVYQLDRLERESSYMLWELVKAGVFSSLLALVLESIFGLILDMTVSDVGLYNLLLYFGVVAVSEEGAKFFMLRRKTWDAMEFDCQYDGVVYAVFLSLGFALWENISYVMHYGFSTALVRAVTAIPGHTSFGVFMGVFYGLARKYQNWNDPGRARLYQLLAVLVPVILHGAYDYIASTDEGIGLFIGFIVILFAASYLLVIQSSKRDTYI